MKQLRKFCPNVSITADRAAADFLILHERQAGGTFGANRNNVAVFGKDDLLVYADGATKLDNSVEGPLRESVADRPRRIALFPSRGVAEVIEQRPDPRQRGARRAPIRS